MICRIPVRYPGVSFLVAAKMQSQLMPDDACSGPRVPYVKGFQKGSNSEKESLGIPQQNQRKQILRTLNPLHWGSEDSRLVVDASSWLRLRVQPLAIFI